MKKPQKFPLHPKHPERICWGCDKYCPADDLSSKRRAAPSVLDPHGGRAGHGPVLGALRGDNGSGRTEHPMEILGEDWYEWEAWGLGPQAGEKTAGKGQG